jgi:hypothetical protein
MGIFNKKSPADRMRKRYEKLMKEAYEVSRVDRKRSDAIYAEADQLMKEISKIEA